MRSPRALVLCIGTELTSGQILNRNAATLSEWLGDLGIEVVRHETVPDQTDLILDCLKRAETGFDLLLVTGGLGPTTDDFTRDVIARWCERKLQFDEGAWKWIEERLGRAGVPVAASNRQQCFFPEGSTLLPNPEGTAYGFALSKNPNLRVYVLPGPPNEIVAIWTKNRIAEELAKTFPRGRQLTLFRWQCLGKSEAALGEVVEKVLQGTPYLTGYRAHRPYVEVKVWVENPTQDSQWPKVRQDLEKAIEPWWVCLDDEDIAQDFLQKNLGKFNLILDSATRGALAERLGSKKDLDPSFVEIRSVFSENALSDVLSQEFGERYSVIWTLESKTASDGLITVTLQRLLKDGLTWKETAKHAEVLPFKGEAYLDRARRFIAEKFLIFAKKH